MPNVIIRILTLVAVLPFFFLPETLKRDVPQTIEEMKKMDKTFIKSLFEKKRSQTRFETLEMFN